MKKVIILLGLLVMSTVYAETVDVSFDYPSTAEPTETVEIRITVKNTSTPYLKNCQASVDLELVGDEIQHFIIGSEPHWDETLHLGESVTGIMTVTITSDEHNRKIRIPIIVSGLKGDCPGGCNPFPPEGPFYIDITVRNKGTLLFNQAELLHEQGEYEEAMKTYDEAKTYFLTYFDEDNARLCIIKIKSCQGYLKFNEGITYFGSGDKESAKESFVEAKEFFADSSDEKMVAECDQWIVQCEPSETESPTTSPPTTPPSPSSTPPTTPSSSTTPAPSSFSYTTLGVLIVLVAAIGMVIFATVSLRKK
jgi:hypothetical protein